MDVFTTDGSLLTLILLVIYIFTLSGCTMVSWESGFESEYTENDDGTLTTNDGKTLNPSLFILKQTIKSFNHFEFNSS